MLIAGKAIFGIIIIEFIGLIILMVKKQLKQSEKLLCKQIVEWLNYQGHFAWRTNVGLAFYNAPNGKKRAFRAGFRGLADIIGILRDGRFLAVECKVGYNKPTPAQQHFLDEINRRGGLAFWTNSFDKAIYLLKEI